MNVVFNVRSDVDEKLDEVIDELKALPFVAGYNVSTPTGVKANFKQVNVAIKGSKEYKFDYQSLIRLFKDVCYKC
ncbi:MAG: hypothetical protein LBC39_09035 [Methanobrevibacter sp.]|nr:hypothetical protein [Candidatus Methanovirga aequatorialis]